jgi:hypothetical protein
MRRREFLGVLGGAAAWPLAPASAQTPYPNRAIRIVVPFGPEQTLRIPALRALPRGKPTLSGISDLARKRYFGAADA